MIRNLLKYVYAKNCRNRWSSDKAIAKNGAVVLPQIVVYPFPTFFHSTTFINSIELQAPVHYIQRWRHHILKVYVWGV